MNEHDKKVAELRTEENRRILRKMRCRICREHGSLEDQEHADVVLLPQQGQGGLLVSEDPELGVLAPQEPPRGRGSGDEEQGSEGAEIVRKILDEMIEGIMDENIQDKNEEPPELEEKEQKDEEQVKGDEDEPVEDQEHSDVVLAPHVESGGLLEGDRLESCHITLQKPTWKMVGQILKDMVNKMLMENDDLKNKNEDELDMEMERMRMEDGGKDTEEEDGWLKKDCDECGPGVTKMKMSLIGLDVEALFPSMTSARTGEIVRRRLMKSKLNPEGFNWKMGLVYIRMNRNLTGSLSNMWKILPFRRKVEGQNQA